MISKSKIRSHYKKFFGIKVIDEDLQMDIDWADALIGDLFKPQFACLERASADGWVYWEEYEGWLKRDGSYADMEEEEAAVKTTTELIKQYSLGE